MCERLEREGVECWLAPRDITPGQEWHEAVVRAIDECSVFLILFSEHTDGSRWVRREIQEGAEADKPPLLIRTDHADPAGNAVLRFYASGHHWLDASSGAFEAHLPRIVDAVRGLVGGSGELEHGDPRPVPRPAAAPSWTETRRLQRIVPHMTDTAGGPWHAVTLGRRLLVVRAAGADVAVAGFGPPGEVRHRWRLRSPVRDIVLTDDGETLVAVAKAQLVLAWLTPEGRLLEWPTRFDLGEAKREVRAARTAGHAVELLLADAASSVRLRVGRGGDATETPHGQRPLRAAAVAEDDFITVDEDGVLHPAGIDPRSAADRELPAEWIDVDVATGGGVALTAALARYGGAYVLHASRADGDGSAARTMALDARPERVVVARPAATYAQPSEVVVQTGRSLLAWSWSDLAELT